MGKNSVLLNNFNAHCIKGGTLNFFKQLKSAEIYILISAFFLFSCGGNEYDDAKEVFTRQIKVMNNYIEGVEKAETAEELITTMREFAQNIRIVTPDLKKILKKYPELNNIDAPTKKIKTVIKEVVSLRTKMQTASKKINLFIGNPDVKQAMNELMDTMSN